MKSELAVQCSNGIVIVIAINGPAVMGSYNFELSIPTGER